MPPVDRELKRERFGWYSYDWAMSVFNTSVTTVFLGPYLTAIARGRRRSPTAAAVPRHRRSRPAAGSPTCSRRRSSCRCWSSRSPAAIADRTGRKREMLAGFAFLGALATTAMFFVADGR